MLLQVNIKDSIFFNSSNPRFEEKDLGLRKNEKISMKMISFLAKRLWYSTFFCLLNENSQKVANPFNHLYVCIWKSANNLHLINNVSLDPISNWNCQGLRTEDQSDESTSDIRWIEPSSYDYCIFSLLLSLF